MEVGSLSSRVMLRSLNPYPLHYRMAFACSIFPYLLLYRHSLRFGFLCRRATGSGTLWVSFRVDTRVL